MSNTVSLIPKKPVRHILTTDTKEIVYIPLASRDSHGIVKIGEGLNITGDGVLSVDFNKDWFLDISTDVGDLKNSVSAIEFDVNSIKINVANTSNKLDDVVSGKIIIPAYQTKKDSGLLTVDKTVVGGINELKDQTNVNKTEIDSITKDVQGVKDNYATIKYVNNLYGTVSMGGHKSVVFDTRDDFITWLDGAYVRTDNLVPENLNIGDMILIKERSVPDYWVSSKSTPMTILDFEEYEAKIEIPEIKLDAVSITKNDEGALQAIAMKNGFVRITDVIDTRDFRGWIELSSADYAKLVEYGSIEVGGEIITFDENGVYVTQDDSYSVLILENAPSQQTKGTVGQLCVDVVAKKLYYCVSDENEVYDWISVEASIQNQLLELQSNVTEITPKVMRALLTPMSAPSSVELVAVDNSNAQKMISFGNSLAVKDDLLNINLYQHYILLYSLGSNNQYLSFSLIDNNPNPYTEAEAVIKAIYDRLGSSTGSTSSALAVSGKWGANIDVRFVRINDESNTTLDMFDSDRSTRIGPLVASAVYVEDKVFSLGG